MPVTYPAKVEAAFARFWAAYPHRPVNPRAPALAVFARLMKAGEDAEALTQAASRYAAVVKAEAIDPMSIPHARKWLHLRYFDDYLTTDVPAPAEPAQPGPEHPMDWARAHVTPAAWASWFSQLVIETDADGRVVVVAPTAFARDRLDTDHRPAFARRYGAGFRWSVKGERHEE